MAVSNQEVAAYLAANPTLSDAQIVSAMAEYGVSPAQMAAVTGLNEGEVVSRVASTLPPGQNANLGGTWVQPVYDSVGQGETFEQGPLKEVMVYKENQTTGDAYNRYSPSGELVGTNKFQEVGGIGDMLSETFTTLSPVIIAALTGGGAAGLLGTQLGLTGTAANVVGGAVLGGGNAALTGKDILKGSLFGGAGAYLTSSGILGGDTGAGNGAWLGDTETLNAVDALNGTSNGAWLGDTETLNAVDALNGTNTSGMLSNAGYYDEITGQFIKDANGGLQSALDNTSGTNINSMNGYTYDAGTQTWTDPTGVKTTALTGVTNNAVTGQDLLKSAGATTSGTDLTASQIANLVKAGVSLTSLVGAGKVVAGGGGGGGGVTTVTSPTEGVPSNSADYYNQLQQYYNAYMPQNPRDVVSPLQSWYSTTYGGAPVNTATNTNTANTTGLFNNTVTKTGTNTPVTVTKTVNPNTVTKTGTQSQYSNQDIVNWLRANPGSSDAQVVAAMQQFGITPDQMSSATGIGLDEITTRYNNVLNASNTNTQTATGTTTPTYTDADIVNWLNANPGSSDVKVAQAMNQFGITPAQMASATGISADEITQRYNAALGGSSNTANTAVQTQYSNQNIVDWLNANPGSSDSTVATAMQQFGITPAQMASATGIGLDEITQRYNAALGR